MRIIPLNDAEVKQVAENNALIAKATAELNALIAEKARIRNVVCATYEVDKGPQVPVISEDGKFIVILSAPDSEMKAV